uniref:Proteasome subunit beta n=1 Tax=Vannella robusta TaxID=1487602 RepID=A0A7S4HGY4_9EUKA|mmetsp:Transcript_10126/g.12492  ORF Transcript_10126/g.12492 Transcript_10126/m.12492 type:complete len:194 (+) Transcript_10126:43-624(+)|eukprot:CAMPEP_0206198590 /NCGR_PEP_ID=MMETSP0166-20121206/9730_1 /ASSEMBLY_ACC=CAM_ASM_000260 /TAXON_ID=95228 /ORGANISM="Vannella robusta, Strain DIVA3 518/3/11/1/6" /LENGTH=193 /DNA_ID=CAMNT_0053616477 /DNA_START=21 /DNA_END=602 /DNA_ORIENTATION=-
MADTVIGIAGKDFVVMAADKSRARSIVIMVNEEDKIMNLERNKLLGASGSPGDCSQFCDLIQKNLNLHRFKTDVPLSTNAAAHFTRNQLAQALRKSPYQCNLLLGGFDEDEGASLYYLDYLASLQKLKYGAQGYASYFVLSILDKDYRPDLTVEDAVALLHNCFAELRQRFMINSPNFIIKVVDANGIRVVEQ